VSLILVIVVGSRLVYRGTSHRKFVASRSCAVNIGPVVRGPRRHHEETKPPSGMRLAGILAMAVNDRFLRSFRSL
jgi:hypothetical protein